MQIIFKLDLTPPSPPYNVQCSCTIVCLEYMCICQNLSVQLIELLTCKLQTEFIKPN